MRVTQRYTRTGSTIHNSRAYDLTAADNVDAEKTKDNVSAWIWQKNGLTMTEAELEFYRKHFSGYIKQRNDRYIHEGHAERCRSIEHYAAARTTRPMETIYQLGNLEDHVSPNILLDIYLDFSRQKATYNREHGIRYTALSYALHTDESTPHIHERGVWSYEDKDGLLRVGQGAALKAAGVPLPDPAKPEGRYNNRKMAYDAIMRDMFITCAKAHVQKLGITIDEDPLPTRKHLPTMEFKVAREADKLQELQQRKRQLKSTVDKLEERVLQADVTDKLEEAAKIAIADLALAHSEMTAQEMLNKLLARERAPEEHKHHHGISK